MFKMNLVMVVAASENDVIGIREGDKYKIPWRIKEDMDHFVGLRMGRPVIMGRSTYESIPEKFRPLQGSKNIILSSTMEPSEGIYVARGIPEALKLAGKEDAIIAGGGIVYREFLPLINRIELTRVRRNYEGNVYLPDINWNEWDIAKKEEGFSERENAVYSFLSYVRK